MNRNDHLTAARDYQIKLAAINYTDATGSWSYPGYHTEEDARRAAYVAHQDHSILVWGDGSLLIRAMMETVGSGSHQYRGKWSIYRFLKCMTPGDGKPVEVCLIAFENEVDAIFTKMLT